MSNPTLSQTTTATLPCSEVSCRAPLVILLISAAVWLVIGSLFSIAASLTFHNPDIFANCAPLTYGRAKAVASNAFLYGFCVQAGIAAILGLFVRIGRAPLAQGPITSVGAALWNFALTIGVAGILAGDSTGFETLELPRYSALLLFLAYVVLGAVGALTLRNRAAGTFYISHWFLIAALFWFPWIYSSATLLLLAFPVRGITQMAIGWWYANNLEFVWFSLVGLGAMFYLIPKLTNRVLHSSYLAAVAFWFLILFASWGGIPNRSPVPAWMPALSTVGTVLSFLGVITVGMNFCKTLGCSFRQNLTENAVVPFRFLAFGLVSFVIAALFNSISSVLQVSAYTDFTWFVPAKTGLQTYGFFAMTMFGAIYYLVPTFVSMTKTTAEGPVPAAFWCPKLARAHFLLAAIGVIVGLLPLAIGGVVQGSQLLNPSTPFMQIAKTTVMFIRVSSIGDFLLLAGHVIFAINLIGGVSRFYKAQARELLAAATADLYATGGRP